jgi:hypothetical protein
MILGGVFDRVDDRLRICFAHGGGSFAFWLGRVDNAWHKRHDVLGTSKYPPSHYLGRFYVDSVVFDERPLRLLVDIVGADRIVVGSDYPYPLGERPAAELVRTAGFLDAETRTKILHRNAESFLGLARSGNDERAAPLSLPAILLSARSRWTQGSVIAGQGLRAAPDARAPSAPAQRAGWEQSPGPSHKPTSAAPSGSAGPAPTTCSAKPFRSSLSPAAPSPRPRAAAPHSPWRCRRRPRRT